MFKYNEKSDLKNGKLVTPISEVEDDLILCLDENGNEIKLNFDDFDFNKTVDERYIEIDHSSDDIITEPEPEESIIPDSSDEDVIEDPKDEDVIEEPEEDEVITEDTSKNNSSVINSQTQKEKSGWITNNSEKTSILYSGGYESTKLVKDVNIWKDVIL